MTSLADKVARVKELDAKRTQGEWVIAADSGANVWTEMENTHIANCMLEVSPNTAWMNASFIAHATQMAALIAEQDAIIQKQREVLVMARETLTMAAPYIAGSYEENLRIPCHKDNYDAAQQTLTAIDNVMKN